MSLKVAKTALATTLCSVILNADEAKTISEISVVSAAGFEQKITDAPASISVVTQDDLRKKSYANLAEAIEDIEGVDVRGSKGKTGGLNISIRGMGAENTLFLIDGRRQNSSGNNTPNGFNETGNNFLPPLSAIERIEVIRGPMGTLYGSDAMGGIVNIITKKVSSEWGGSVDIDKTLMESSQFGDSHNLNTYISGPIIKDLLGLNIRGSYYGRDASSVKYSDGAPTGGGRDDKGYAPVEAKNYSLGAKLNFTPFSNHDFYLDGFISNQKYNNEKAQLGTLNSATASQGYDTFQRYERAQVALGHTSRFDIGTLESSIMRNITETKGRLIPGKLGVAYVGMSSVIGGEKRELKNTDTVLDSKFIAPIGDMHMVTLGGQYWKSKMVDGLVEDEFSQKLWAIFLEDEISITDNFALTLGGRYDKHNQYSGHFSPRAYAVYALDDSWTIKGGVSRGYKAPRVNDLHDGINGATRQGQTLTIGTPTLKPEKSTNYEVGLYYSGNSGFSANGTIFYNEYSDKIEDEGVRVIAGHSTIPDGTYTQKKNVGKAETKGFEFGTKIPLMSDLSLNANYTYLKSEKKNGENAGEPLINTPKHTLNATLNYMASEKLSAWLKGEYRSKRVRYTNKKSNLTAEEQAIYDQVGNYINAYTLFSLGGSYRYSKDITFSASIYNLFDKDMYKRNSYTFGGVTKYANMDTPIEGRRLWLAMNVAF